MTVEYLDPSIAGEGVHVDSWKPGAWTDSTADNEEYQPDIEPPHINDYAAFKKHKHYRQYFRPYRYQPFPAWMYHRTLEPKLVRSKEEVLALGPDWSPTPNKPRVDMTGKTLPVKTDTQRLTEAMVAGLASKQATGAGPVDAAAIAAIVAAVMAAMPGNAPAAQPAPATPEPEPLRAFLEASNPDDPDRTIDADKIERTALIELAEKEGVKIDGRWSNDRIKSALGL